MWLRCHCIEIVAAAGLYYYHTIVGYGNNYDWQVSEICIHSGYNYITLHHNSYSYLASQLLDDHHNITVW